MERLMMWSGNNSTAKIAVVDDLSSWEMINHSDEDDIQSLSFSESLSENEKSSDDEQTGFEEEVPEEDDLEGDGRSGLGEADVGRYDHIMNACSSFNQRSIFDDDQNGDERSGFEEEVLEEDDMEGDGRSELGKADVDHYDHIMTAHSSFNQWSRFDDDQKGDERSGFKKEVSEEDERPGYDDLDSGANMLPELVPSQFDDIVLREPSLVNQRWRFEEDSDESGHNMLPESDMSPIDQRWGFNNDQDGDEWPGFDEHSIGLWEYTVQLIGLGQFDDHVPSDPPSTPLMDEVVENQQSGSDDDKHYDQRLKLDDNDNDYDQRLKLDGNDNDDEDDSDDVNDLDDNLVPYYASNRFGNQRMGKVGKKVYGKKYKRYK